MTGLFQGIFDSSTATVISPSLFLLCVGVALICGIIITFSYVYKENTSKSFTITLSLLPAIVCVVIMMVNGNVGTGVAVAGTFSLVRFRSLPGTAKEIGAIFLAMGAGLIAGMGYLAYALLFSLLLALIWIIYSSVYNVVASGDSPRRTLTITIPEDLNYSNIFDDLFTAYTVNSKLILVKTTNLGSMFKLTYDITLKNTSNQKEFIDQLRCRNGNLEIMLSPHDTSTLSL